MKESLQRIKKNITDSKGETLMESIISLLILSVLLVAVATMIQAALGLTNSLTQRANSTQEDTINPVILTDYSNSITNSIIFFAEDGSISAAHDVLVFNEDGLVGFSPADAGD